MAGMYLGRKAPEFSKLEKVVKFCILCRVVLFTCIR